LAKLEQRFASIDPVLVRTAAFALLRRGLDCPTIASRPLGPDSCLETK
jgi:hypothetical protein